MLATFIQLLQQFPALWAVLGILATFLLCGIGALVAILILKKYGPAATGAAKELIVLQTRAVELQESTVRMQKEHYEAEAGFLREEIAQWKASSKSYETTLHDKRNEWNAEKLAMTATIEQLKSRPDITSLFEFETQANERREAFYGKLGSTMQTISDSLTKHDQDVSEKVAPMMEALTEILAQSKRQMKVLGVILRKQREAKAATK
jgi:hypothetical protein